MIDDATHRARTDRLNTLLGDKLGLRRGTLARRAARAGRRLPQAIRHDIGVVDTARFLSGHPRLRHVPDARQVGDAYARVVAHLESIDVADRRKGAAIGILASVLLNLLAVVVLVLVVLVWRGFL